MTPKVIFIDIDGTLIDFEKGAQDAMYSAAKTHGVTLPADIYVTFKRINTGLWQSLEKGELTREELHAVRWNRIFKAAGVDFDGPTFEKTFFANLYESAFPVEGAYEILEYLHSKYPLYAASNAIYSQQVTRLTKADMLKYLKGLFTSERIGFAKPSEEFYAACVKETEPVNPEEILMIGDSLSADVIGAKKFGLSTCWYSPDGGESEYADYTVTKLTDIMKIV